MRALGFVLLEDLGSSSYLSQLHAGADADALYADALQTLLRIQIKGREAARELPPYDRSALGREMALMPEWFCERHLGLELEPPERNLIDTHLRVPDSRSAGAADSVRASRLSFAQSHGARAR